MLLKEPLDLGLRYILNNVAKIIGIAIIRLKTHRSINLLYDLRRLFKEGASQPIMIDVGANVGQFTKIYLSWFPEASVFAIEPVPNTYKILENRLGKYKNVKIFNVALGEKEADVNMTNLVENSTENRIVSLNNSVSADLIKVKQLALDTIVDSEGITYIDLLKTDCEGYYLEVLKGAQGLFKHNRIGAVYSEVEFSSEGTHASFIDINNFLINYGFMCYGLYGASGVNCPLRYSYFNALWLPKHSIS